MHVGGSITKAIAFGGRTTKALAATPGQQRKSLCIWGQGRQFHCTWGSTAKTIARQGQYNQNHCNLETGRPKPLHTRLILRGGCMTSIFNVELGGWTAKAIGRPGQDSRFPCTWGRTGKANARRGQDSRFHCTLEAGRPQPLDVELQSAKTIAQEDDFVRNRTSAIFKAALRGRTANKTIARRGQENQSHFTSGQNIKGHCIWGQGGHNHCTMGAAEQRTWHLVKQPDSLQLAVRAARFIELGANSHSHCTWVQDSQI